MASSTGAIRAGAAFVELYADSSNLNRGLNESKAKVSAYASHVKEVERKLKSASKASDAATVQRLTPIMSGLQERQQTFAQEAAGRVALAQRVAQFKAAKVAMQATPDFQASPPMGTAGVPAGAAGFLGMLGDDDHSTRKATKGLKFGAKAFAKGAMLAEGDEAGKLAKVAIFADTAAMAYEKLAAAIKGVGLAGMGLASLAIAGIGIAVAAIKLQLDEVEDIKNTSKRIGEDSQQFADRLRALHSKENDPKTDYGKYLVREIQEFAKARQAADLKIAELKESKSWRGGWGFGRTGLDERIGAEQAVIDGANSNEAVARRQLNEERTKADNKPLQQHIEALKAEIATIGKSTDEINRYNLAKATQVNGTDAETAALLEEIDALNKLKKMSQASQAIQDYIKQTREARETLGMTANEAALHKVKQQASDAGLPGGNAYLLLAAEETAKLTAAQTAAENAKRADDYLKSLNERIAEAKGQTREQLEIFNLTKLGAALDKVIAIRNAAAELAKIEVDREIATLNDRIAVATGKMTELDVAMKNLKIPNATAEQLEAVRAKMKEASIAEFAKGEKDTLKTKADLFKEYRQKIEEATKAGFLSQPQADKLLGNKMRDLMGGQESAQGTFNAAAAAAMFGGKALDRTAAATESTDKKMSDLLSALQAVLAFR